jgi:uncharacterized membrane protein
MPRRRLAGCSRSPPERPSGRNGAAPVLALRIIGIIVLLATLTGIVLYFFTRDRRYLRFAFQLFKYAVIFALFLFGLLILERGVMLV